MCAFLKEAAKLPSYGTEVYNAKLECRDNTEINGTGNSIQHSHTTTVNVIIRLGPLGLEIIETKTEEIRRYLLFLLIIYVHQIIDKT